MRTAVCGIILIFLCGCVTQQDRLDWLATHPDTPPRIAQAVSQGAITQGMTKAQVRASWGTPCGLCYGTTQSSWGDTWEYNPLGYGSYSTGTIVYFDSAGRVRGWFSP